MKKCAGVQNLWLKLPITDSRHSNRYQLIVQVTQFKQIKLRQLKPKVLCFFAWTLFPSIKNILYVITQSV